MRSKIYALQSFEGQARLPDSLAFGPHFQEQVGQEPHNYKAFKDLLTSPPRAGHGHSHGDVDLGAEDGIVAMARGFLVVLALSIHDLFEGVALGVARS